MIHKIADVYKKTFPVRSKKRVYHFVAGELLLVLKMCYKCLDREFTVEQSKIYFTVIGQAFHELWQFETRHANARNIRAVLILYILFQVQFSGLCRFNGQNLFHK